MTSTEDGFRAHFPGQPTVEPITYATEFRMTLPGRVYRASDALGRYSTTVVDYRDIERMHNERAATCRAARGANEQDGDTCQNDFVLEVAGAMDHAISQYLKRDGVTVTQYGLYFVEVVSGRLLQLTNPDQSRTHVAVHQHAGRLYVHEATVPKGRPGDSIRVRCHLLRDGAKACLLGFVTPMHGDPARGHGVEKEWD